MAKEHLIIDGAPPIRAPYSHAVVANGPFVFISGQAPFTTADELVQGSFRDQALQTFENVRTVLVGAGSSLENIVRVGIYLQDWANFPELNELYADFFPQPLPVRTCIPTALTRFALEVDAVATLSEPPAT